MKRNNKGFTLIELLAAVVILGILIAISVPIITGLFDNSRKKMYVSDARKLIALAEYRVQASSSTIEKPDEGDCILISMLYLDSSDFDNPPGEGTYLKENSYVVVRNNGGKLEFAATVVEKIKGGGYKGVELTKNSDLISSGATSHVLATGKIDVLHVETDITRGYINEKLGHDYIPIDNGITAIYNQPELEDNSASSNLSNSPKIVSASMTSTTNKYFNTLEATLQLKVTDRDTPKNDLKVYINVDSGYSKNVTPKRYYDGFTYDFNFATYGKTYYSGDTVKIYVIVEDTDGNSAKKTITYKIHKNEAPHIDSSSGITRRDQDVYYGVPKNMLEAKITFIASDDLDNASDLQVCMMESPTDEDYDTCIGEYKQYTSVFRQGVISSYRFSNCGGNVCTRDGSTHYLTIFIKDKQGETNKKKFSYTLSINQQPKLVSFSMRSNGLACIRGLCPIENGGNKQILVTATVTDDVDPYYNDMYIVVYDKHTGQNNVVIFTKNDNNKQLICDLGGLYDGQTRDLEIYLMDSEGLMSTNKEYRTYKLYLNKAPKITTNGFSIASRGTACRNSELCPIATAGGNKTVNVSLNVEDDVDLPTSSMTTVCLTTDDNATVDTCRPYLYYKDFHNKTATYTMSNQIYDGSKKNIRVFVKDSEGLWDTSVVNNYLLYTNKKPEIKIATFSSDPTAKPLSGGSLNTIFRLEAVDDVDDPTTLQVQIKEDGVVRQEYATVDKWMKKEGSNWVVKDNKYRLYGIHDGIDRTIKIQALDTDEATSDVKTITYPVALGQPPTILNNGLNVYSAGKPCINNSFCTSGNINGKIAKVEVRVSDDIDDNKELKICLSESNDNCTIYKAYSDYLDGDDPKPVNYSFNANTSMPYDGSVHTLYLHVKDSDNNEVVTSKTYQLYRNVAPRLGTPTITTNADDHITKIPDVTYKITAEDDLDSTLRIKYCHRKDGGAEYCTDFENYHENKVLDNSFFNTNRPSGETYRIYSIVKDSYGVEVKSEEVEYTLDSDADPSIYVGFISFGKKIYKNMAGDVVESLEGVQNPGSYILYHRLVLNFSVDDPYDTYSICVNNNDYACTNYEGVYAGNNCTAGSACGNRILRGVYYDIPPLIQNGENPNLYLFVKDSYDSVTTTPLYTKVYNECEELDDINLIYEFEFDSAKTQSTYGHTNSISMSRCDGKCYYQDNILSIYRASITNSDLLNYSLVCNANNPDVDEEYIASCDHKDCFYKNNNYNRNAIGTRLYNDSESWTFSNNGTNYVCTGHYNLYQSRVERGFIVLDRVGTVCNAAVSSGVYNYNGNASEPYIRVQD